MVVYLGFLDVFAVPRALPNAAVHSTIHSTGGGPSVGVVVLGGGQGVPCRTDMRGGFVGGDRERGLGAEVAFPA